MHIVTSPSHSSSLHGLVGRGRLFFSLLVFAASLAFAACGDGEGGSDHADGGPDGQSLFPCDNDTCTSPPPIACFDDSTLRTHADDGTCREDDTCEYESTDIDCGNLGCCADHCCEVSPSNSGGAGSLEETGLIIGPPNGTFHTADDCTEASVLGQCHLVEVGDSPDLCICNMDELTIGNLSVSGGPALVILAYRHVVISGTLTVAGDGAASGPGAGFEYDSAATSMSGGAGGSYGSAGGYGAAAEPYGNEQLVPLVGGMRGQDSCNSRAGGGGGGALQITAGQSVTVSGTINAGGGGGSGGSGSGSCLGGAGGGSGGGVLIEAPAVEISGIIAANGGGGGGAGNDSGSLGYAGQDGSGGTTTAFGGQGRDGFGCPLYGYTSGGDGGSGSAFDANGQPGQGSDSEAGCIGGADYVGAGGAGGGAGRIRVNTDTGCVCAGTFSPTPSFGQLEGI